MAARVVSKIAKSAFMIYPPRLVCRNRFHDNQSNLHLIRRTSFTSSSGSGSGSASAHYPFSTVPSNQRKDAATTKVDQPKSKSYTIDDFAEIEEAYRSEYYPILASPLVQIFSVSIDTNFDDERPCKLYGLIRATEREGTASFSLYDRDHDSPETILKHGYLSLIGPQCNNDFPCSLGNTSTKMDLYLRDKTRNIEFIKAQVDLDCNTEEAYDKLQKAVVRGEHGSASVYYATFQFAAFAFVEVAIFAKYDESRPFCDVYGSIVAGYANSKSYHSCEDGDMESTLFNKSADEFVRTPISTPLSLSRYVVAVPVHSSLKIQAHLWDLHLQDGPFASGFVEFLAAPHSASNKLIFGEGGSVVVAVTWDNAFNRVYDAKDMTNYAVEEEEEEEIDHETKGTDNAQKNSLVLSDQLLPLSENALRSTHSSQSKLRPVRGDEVIEVLSIFIDSKANESPSVCGCVRIVPSGREFCIFDRDMSDPEFCSAGKRMLSLGSSGWIMYFYMMESCIRLYLKDPVKDLEISKGTIAGRPSFDCYDKRICSVIEGAHGYAAVHYIIFSYGCKAFIDMTIFIDDPIRSSANIYGHVFARYGSHDYSSVYDKKYYQTRLFDKPQAHPVKLTNKSSKLRIPLSRSALSMPVDDSLIVEANLWVANPNQDVAVSGTVEFEADNKYESCIIHKEIYGQRYRIQISIKFACGALFYSS